MKLKNPLNNLLGHLNFKKLCISCENWTTDTCDDCFESICEDCVESHFDEHYAESEED